MTGKQSSGSQSQTKGRHRFNNNRSSKTNATSKPHKKSLQDCQCHLGSAKQASDCQQATEFIVNHIKKVFEYGADVRSALEELKAVDMNKPKPKLQVSNESDAAVKAAEDGQFEMEFKA